MKISERQLKESARDYAFRVIKENIISLDLISGSMVSETELSTKLGLSRTPVREALIELSKTKIISLFQLIDTDLVEEDRFLRLVLENAMVKMACDVATEEDIISLETNLKLQDFYLQNPSPDKLLKLDNEFHHLLFSICKKERTYALMNSATIHFDRVRSLSLVTIKDIKIVEDHQAILTAIKNRDKKGGEMAMTKHLTRYKIDDQLLRTQYPRYYKYR